MRKLLLVCSAVLLVVTFIARAQDSDSAAHLINHRGQELFLNGINLAWVNFARDLKDFDEVRFVAALDEIVAAKGNTLRWWLHTNGSTSPVYSDDGKVIGLGENDIENLRRALDLAYERGILIMPTLWSHDMMNNVEGVPTDSNKRMIEDPEYTQAYIDNALIPLVEALKGHPGIVAWEIFNEPEGVTGDFGWTDQRTDMPHVQQFVNLLAGAIHRADPEAKVTNGSWNMQVLTDIEGMTNYYRDDRLTAAGGDADGTLDFYQVHYYPEWFDETTSPFHNPYSHWELDKPLVIGEFPAKAIADLGMGFRPRKQLRNSMESYEYLYENGYAGALAWTFYTSPHGKMLDAAPGMLRINNLSPEQVQVDVGDVDHIPVIQKTVDNLVVPLDTAATENYVDLKEIFLDTEDGTSLSYTISENSKPEVVEAAIDDSGLLSLAFPSGNTGTSALEVTATDSAGHYSRVQFVVQVVDPTQGNVALGKTAVSSTVESVGYLPEFAVDGLDNTRWSTEYADDQWLDVDLGGVFTITQVILRWEVAYGAAYEIQVWDGSAWQTIFGEPAGDGQIDDITLAEPVNARHVRMNGITRGTEWGFSLWEFEVLGTIAAEADPTLETPPDDGIDAAASAGEAEQAAVETTLLTGFESGAEGWQLADYWAGSVSLDISGDMANEGVQSLALQVTYSGDGTWQEAGVFFQPQGGEDWSSASQLVMDVYLPEGADSFIGQIFVKTGSAWTWANTPDTMLAAGQWTTITADLSSMGDLTAVNEYGVKVGTGVTAFEGIILIDNVRLVSSVSAAESGDKASTTASGPVEPQVNAINSVTLLQDAPRLYEKVELVADIDAVFNNPYDPADIRVDGRFVTPSGKTIIVPAFYYRDFNNNGGTLTPTNDWSWRVRFTPTEVGEYRYQILATTLKGAKRSDSGTFTVSESDSRGFVRVDERNPRYFVFDDGTPYFPVGEDMAWSTGNPLTDYPMWLDKLQASGGNFIRVWMASWGFGIEWVDTGLGNYDRRQAQAYQLDRLMDMAAERDVYIMLSLLNHGAFNTATDPQWDQNPYNTANGGPCAEPECFATDPEAIRLWNQRLRYIAARWGYSPNIMAWEWWNEINWTALVNPNLLVPWIERSASYLRSLDPYHHLITHSGSPSGDAAVWGLDSIDFTQDHQYNMTNLHATFNEVVPNWLERYPNKPFLMGEFGSPAEIDTQGVLIHQGLWSAPMNGASGTAMTWWWDNYIHPLDLYYHFAGVSAFFRDEDMAARQWQPASADFAEATRANVYGLQTDDYALLWVVNRDYSNQYVQQAYNDVLRDALRAGLVYSFEENLDGWALVGDWTAGKGTASSADLATEGDSSLALEVAYSGGGTWQEAGVFVQPESGADWSIYTTVSIDIYVPEGGTDLIAQVYTKTGDAWAWTNSQDNALTPGQWNKVMVPLSALGDMSDVREFGLKIGSSAGVFAGTLNLDSVRLGGAQPSGAVEFPAVEGAVLVVQGFQPGSYQVEFWDTIAGTVVGESTVESSDGSVQIALPTFTADVAIKVKGV